MANKAPYRFGASTGSRDRSILEGVLTGLVVAVASLALVGVLYLSHRDSMREEVRANALNQARVAASIARLDSRLDAQALRAFHRAQPELERLCVVEQRGQRFYALYESRRGDDASLTGGASDFSPLREPEKLLAGPPFAPALKRGEAAFRATGQGACAVAPLGGDGGDGNRFVLLESGPGGGEAGHAGVDRQALIMAIISLCFATGVGLILCRVRHVQWRREQDQIRQLVGVVEQNPCSIVITDRHATIRYVNPKFCEVTGWTPEEVIGKNPRVLKSGGMSPESYKMLWDTLLQGKVWHGELLNRKKDGQLFWESASISPIFSVEGEVSYYVAVKEDITLKKLEETVLKRSNSLLEAQQEAVIDGLLVVDENDKISSWNSRFCQLWNLEPVGLECCDEAELFAHITGQLEDADAFLTRQKHLALHPRRDSRDEVLFTDGRILDCYCSPIVSENGEYYGRLWTFRDVTEVNRSHHEIRQAKEAAENSNMQLAEAMERLRDMADQADEASRSKSEFLANMSHEIRTPMNAVMGMTTLLRDTKLTTEQQDYVDIIRNSSDSLLTIINDILDFSKIEAGKLTLETVPFSLVSTFEDTLDLVSNKAAEKKIDLVWDIADDVPVHVLGDPTRLRQILINLAGNAVKFTEEGEVHLSVERAGSDEAGLFLRFRVRDTGIGIAPDRLNSLFQPFSQADNSTTRKYGGTGLGLVICRRLCDLMNGSIWVESEMGEGSAFTFEIVMAPDPEPPGEEAPLDLFAGKRLLVVDHNPANTHLFTFHTRPWKIQTVETNTGSEALRVIKDGPPPDVAIVDNALPDLDGFSLVSMIRNQPGGRHLPIVMFTSMGMRKVPEELRDLSISGVLTKPIKQSSLVGMLTRVFEAGPIQTRPPIPPKPETEDEQALEGARDGDGSGKTIRILLAEDNAVNQKVAMLLLKRLGFAADVAGNGREAVEAVRRQSYDLIFMDLHMPEMGGLEATRHILEIIPEDEAPYIVAMTAAALQKDRNAAIESGMKDFVTKPVKVAEVERVLKHVEERIVSHSG